MAYEQFMDQEITNAAGTSTIKLKEGGIAEIVRHEDEDKVGTIYGPGDDAYEFIREQIQGLTNNLLPANQLDGNRTYTVSGNYSYIGNPDGTVDWVSGGNASPDNPIKVSKGMTGYNEIVAENFGSPAKLQQQTQPAVDQGDLNKALGPVGGDAAAEEEVAEATGVAEDGRPEALVTERQRALDKLYRQARRGEISERAAAALRGGMVASGIAVEAQRETDDGRVKQDYIKAITDLNDDLRALKDAEGTALSDLRIKALESATILQKAKIAGNASIDAATQRALAVELDRTLDEQRKLSKHLSIGAMQDTTLANKFGSTVLAQIDAAKRPDGSIDMGQSTTLINNLQNLLGGATDINKVRLAKEFQHSTGMSLEAFAAAYQRELGLEDPQKSNQLLSIARSAGTARDTLYKEDAQIREAADQYNRVTDQMRAAGVGGTDQVAGLFGTVYKAVGGEAFLKAPDEGAEDALSGASAAIKEQIDKFNAALEADPTGVSSAQIKEAIMGTSEFQDWAKQFRGVSRDLLFDNYRKEVKKFSKIQDRALAESKEQRGERQAEKLEEAGYEAPQRRGAALQKLFFPKKAKPVATAEGIEEGAEAEVAQETPEAEVATEEAVVDTSTPAAAPAATVVEAESPTPRAETEPTTATGAERRADLAERRKAEIQRITKDTRQRLADILTGKQKQEREEAVAGGFDLPDVASTRRLHSVK